MTRQMAIDFGPLGIRVNAICPGHIVTEGLGKMWEDNAEGLKFFEQQYPVRRTGMLDDIASDCVTSTVGRPVTGPADLTRAEIQQIFASCLQPTQ